MSDDTDWPEASPKPERRGAARWLIPLVAFLAGGGLVAALTPAPAPQPALSPQVTVPSAPVSSSAAAQEVELFRQINAGFVEQLRKYHVRLREIADVAEAEGASSAAKQMEDFALETELVIDRYDKILKTER